MKITITGEHEGKSVTIAVWEYSPEVVKGNNGGVVDSIVAIQEHFFGVEQ